MRRAYGTAERNIGEMMFLKAANKSIDDAVHAINQITNNMMFDSLREELFQSIVSAVHFIADCEERVRAKLTPDDAEMLKAFLYVNNQLKHDVSLELFYYDVSGSMFPMRFPFRFGKPGVYWREFIDNGNHRARGKREHYEKYLMNKDIEATLLRVREILNKYST